MKKFNVFDMLNSNSQELGNKEENAVMLSIFDIEESESNFYSTADVDDLADSIEMLGIQQNLVVKKLEDGKYRLIAGHRRRLACLKLTEEGKKDFEFVPCIIDTSNDPVKEKLILILTNSTARELSDYEKVEQARQLKELLTEYKKEHKVPGRVRELIAGALNVSSTQVARMDSISNNLSEDLKKEFKEEKINISTAYEISGLDSEQQKEVYKQAKEKESNGDTFNISLKEIKERKKEVVLEPEQQDEPEISDRYEVKTPIDDLDFSVMTYNCLKRAGIDTVEQLCKMTEVEVIKIRNISGRYLNEIKETLASIGKGLRVQDNKGNPEETEESKIFDNCKHQSNYLCDFPDASKLLQGDGNACDEEDEKDPEAYNLSDVKNEIRKNTDDLKMCRDEDLASPIRYKTKMKLDAFTGLSEKMQETADELDKGKHPNIKGFMDDPYCPDCGEALIYKCDCLKCGCKINWKPVKGLFEYEEEQIQKKFPETSEPDQKQSELPVLKNNDQRKEWIDNYETWPVWIDQPLTGERYYRYDFDDSTSFVIRVSLRHVFKGYERTEEIKYGREEYFLLGVKDKWIPGIPTFAESSTNKSAMIEHLKEIQKKGV